VKHQLRFPFFTAAVFLASTQISLTWAGIVVYDEPPSAIGVDAPLEQPSGANASASSTALGTPTKNASPVLFISSGKTLRESISTFLVQNHWRLSWEVEDWIAMADESISGDSVEDVLEKFGKILSSHSPGAYNIVVYQGNKFVRVSSQ